MKNKLHMVFILLLLTSCEQKTEKVEVKPDTIYRVSTEMIKTPDGNLYFPDSYLRPKSEEDVRVKVLPKVNNPDSLPVIDLK